LHVSIILVIVFCSSCFGFYFLRKSNKDIVGCIVSKKLQGKLPCNRHEHNVK
jgi:hypothetical protein